MFASGARGRLVLKLAAMAKSSKRAPNATCSRSIAQSSASAQTLKNPRQPTMASESACPATRAPATSAFASLASGRLARSPAAAGNGLEPKISATERVRAARIWDCAAIWTSQRCPAMVGRILRLVMSSLVNRIGVFASGASGGEHA